MNSRLERLPGFDLMPNGMGMEFGCGCGCRYGYGYAHLNQILVEGAAPGIARRGA